MVDNTSGSELFYHFTERNFYTGHCWDCWRTEDEWVSIRGRLHQPEGMRENRDGEKWKKKKEKTVYVLIVWADRGGGGEVKGISASIRPNLSPIHLKLWYHQPLFSLLIKDKRDPQQVHCWPAAAENMGLHFSLVEKINCQFYTKI